VVPCAKTSVTVTGVPALENAMVLHACCGMGTFMKGVALAAK
jgi:hypothetical protein